ncbi:MAG: hypothetical protein H7338_16065 [Candidatus Sericytochromatia bacterium]|nr:hypothetical protein [Candidatus Sericytochromatia bacterium]
MYLDVALPDDDRRQRLFEGDFFQYAALPSVQNLCQFARSLAIEAFGDRDPEFAQFTMPVSDYVPIIGALKRKFTNHPESRRLVQAILSELGCDLAETYFDVPRLRVITAGGYLTSGMGYAYQLHRDIWYSSPEAQINWWLPVYDVVPERTLRFFPDYYTVPVANSSADFDYGDWTIVGREQAATMITADTRQHPLPIELIDRSRDLLLVGPQATLFNFSAVHLHESVPNTTDRTRFSIDLRTVHRGDLIQGRRAPNVDGRARGTTLGDFLRGTDFAPLPTDFIAEILAKR